MIVLLEILGVLLLLIYSVALWDHAGLKSDLKNAQASEMSARRELAALRNEHAALLNDDTRVINEMLRTARKELRELESYYERQIAELKRQMRRS